MERSDENRIVSDDAEYAQAELFEQQLDEIANRILDENMEAMEELAK